MDNSFLPYFPDLILPVAFMVRQERSWKYIIELPVLPFLYKGKEYITSVRLDNVDFKTANLDHLTEKTFEFLLNPEEDYIDASICILGTHVLLDIKKIHFTKILHYHHISLVQTKFEINFLFSEVSLQDTVKIINTNLIIYN